MVRRQRASVSWRSGASGPRAAAFALAVALGGPAGATQDVPVRQAAVATTPAAIRCDGIRVGVLHAGRVDAALICAGARDAIGFLAAQGLDVAVEVTIEVVDALPELADASAAGCYLPQKRRVYLLSYADFAPRGGWFGLSAEPELYRSVAAHEVAHAISGCNFKVEQPSLQAWEYVAYVAMLETMAPELRRRVLARHAGDGFDNEAQINATVYLVNPEHFAVEAYRHFLRRGNGRAYLHAILAGKALAE